MSETTFLQIKELLDKNTIRFTHLVHEHVKTSEDAARVRGTRLEDAAKALIVSVERRDENKNRSYELVQAVLAADRKLDLKKFRNILCSKNISLASPEHVLEKTGCSIGSVPPFGNLFGIKVYADEDLLKKEEMVFSAGTHTDSIKMNPQDWGNIVNPVVVELKKE